MHDVRICRPFAIGQYEVTLAEFRRFVQATGHVVPGGPSPEAAPAAPWQRVE